ncbi:MAG: thiamine phosphate synthase [Rhodospirillaceae bacterium]|nr:thiamine phosphate synthase [Rhodospirillaceae bacterium]MBT5664590.1 thiamine phosphate synthase [Rhodospirillaceae bacterium]MBT5812519.1 thiamine phosphate synthase [Rhodospirillaceae bacterium]
MTEPDNPGCRLYLITPPRIDAAAFATPLAEALDAGDIACVQLRLKDVSDDDIRRAADILRPVTQERDVAFIMNDRPDLAHETGSDGVHIGLEDTGYEETRLILGPDSIVGVTCSDSRDRAMAAANAGASYVAFGAFYHSETKPPKHRPTPDILEWWSEIMETPCVAIGGITVQNCAPLVSAGADFISVVSAIWDNPDGPGAAVQAFNKVFDDLR